jgi:pimeloyl-ACP methyl ester carboxylesterase
VHGIASAVLIPGARFVVEAGCGHFPWIERPGSVRKALEQVLG